MKKQRWLWCSESKPQSTCWVHTFIRRRDILQRAFFRQDVTDAWRKEERLGLTNKAICLFSGEVTVKEASVDLHGKLTKWCSMVYVSPRVEILRECKNPIAPCIVYYAVRSCLHLQSQEESGFPLKDMTVLQSSTVSQKANIFSFFCFICRVTPMDYKRLPGEAWFIVWGWSSSSATAWSRLPTPSGICLSLLRRQFITMRSGSIFTGALQISSVTYDLGTQTHAPARTHAHTHTSAGCTVPPSQYYVGYRNSEEVGQKHCTGEGGGRAKCTDSWFLNTFTVNWSDKKMFPRITVFICHVLGTSEPFSLVSPDWNQ